MNENFLDLLRHILRFPVDTAFKVTLSRSLAEAMASSKSGPPFRQNPVIKRKLLRVCDSLFSVIETPSRTSGEKFIEKLAIAALNILSVDLPKLLKDISEPISIVETLGLWKMSLALLREESFVSFANSKADHLVTLLRRCLKVGIVDLYKDDSDLEVRMESIRNVSAMIRRSISFSTENLFGSTVSFCDVYSMTVNHSKFTLLFSDENEGRLDPLVVEVLNLLQTCLEHSSQAIVIERSSWKLIFSRFGAGMKMIDTSVRELLETYNDRASRTGVSSIATDRFCSLCRIDSRSNTVFFISGFQTSPATGIPMGKFVGH